MGITSDQIKKLKRGVFPTIGIITLAFFWYIILVFSYPQQNEPKNNTSLRTTTGRIVRCYYALVLALSMEYIARYEHKFLWHSKWLWFIHASHHHQRTKLGSGPSKNDFECNKYIAQQYNIFEMNDTFPAIFASLAIITMYWAFSEPNPSFLHDIVFGSSVGISAYGTSYFIGHDLCAHARGGRELAEFLKSISPMMKRCAELHNSYHHKMDVDAGDNDDPYGPPYGFWLGPQEVQSWKESKKELGMPLIFKLALTCGAVFFIFASNYFD